MWMMKETDDELTITGFPLIMWSFVLLSFITGFFILQTYVESAGGLLMIRKLFEGSFSDILTNAFVLSFSFICGLILFAYSPLIITKINRRSRTLRYIKVGLLGKRVDKYSYDSLDGGVRVKAEEDEDENEQLKVYFKIKSGVKIYMSSDVSMVWKGKVYDVAMKANEYLQSPIEHKN